MEAPETLLHEPDFNYSGTYTYADYVRWTIEERLELIPQRQGEPGGHLLRMLAIDLLQRGLDLPLRFVPAIDVPGAPKIPDEGKILLHAGSFLCF